MSSPTHTLPVFALDEDMDWEDLMDAIQGSVEYQSSKRGKFVGLFLFSPMTTPENMDAWEPMKVLPENLLMVSIERDLDRRVIKALTKAKDTVGELRHAGEFPPVSINHQLPLADVYRQMEEAGVLAFCQTFPGKDSPSFFFLRGPESVKAFDRNLRGIV